MKVFWLRDERKFPVACVASEVIRGVLCVGLSIFNPKDDFDRLRGRRIAEARMGDAIQEKHLSIFKLRLLLTPGEAAIPKATLMEELCHSTDYPQQVRRAARLWLDRPREVH